MKKNKGENIGYWLSEGPQTKITPEIRNLAGIIGGEGFKFILNSFSWLKGELSHQNLEKYFRTRTADEIITSRISSGCGDMAVSFCALARAQKIPCKYLEMPLERWLEEGRTDFFENHVLAQVFVEGDWYWVDPSRGNLGIKGPYNVAGDQDYVLLAEGLDSWDIGINSWESFKEKYLKFRTEWQRKTKSP